MTTFIVLILAVLLIGQSKRLHREQRRTRWLRRRIDTLKQKQWRREVRAADRAMQDCDRGSRVEFTQGQNWPGN